MSIRSDLLYAFSRRANILAWATLTFVAMMPLAAKDHGTTTVLGVVTGVSDGDTAYLTINNQPERVRLDEIDAPEKGQPWGRRSEQSLRELIWKKEVVATWRKRDPYGRPLVQIRLGDLNVNAAQVERGMAWVYTQYSNDPKLRELENEARQAKRGLWFDAKPIAPWDWRRANSPTKGPQG